jgi:NADH dehydrogenase
MITRQEIKGLMSELLYVDSPPAGKTKLTDWINDNTGSLGKKYTSELARRKNRRLEL